MVSGEVAAAVLLLCGAGLLLRTLLVLVNVDTGYRVDGVPRADAGLQPAVRPNTPRPTPESLMQFYDDVAREVEARPEVESVGWTSSLPYGTTSELGFWSIEVVGDATRPRRRPAKGRCGGGRRRLLPDTRPADRGRTRLHRSRLRRRTRASASSTKHSSGVCSGAGTRWACASRCSGLRRRTPIVKEIVGVARQTSGWAQPSGRTSCRSTCRCRSIRPGTYTWWPRASTGPAEALTPIVRSIVAQHDPNTPVRRDRTLEFLSVESTAGYRFRAAMVGTFAGLALVLAMIGVFGVLAYSVQQRQREFGVRVALGATSPSILWLVLGSAGRLIAVGGTIGLVLAFLLGRSIASFLFGVPPVDPVTFGGVALVVILAAAAAAAAPAWRAARVDPVMMFRAD